MNNVQQRQGKTIKLYNLSLKTDERNSVETKELSRKEDENERKKISNGAKNNFDFNDTTVYHSLIDGTI